MNHNTRALVIAFALIGVLAVLYSGWRFIETHETEEHSRAMLAAPAPSGLPDIFHDAPLPKQP
jgi:uncharacterized membrane protein YozB (DUF420 family)